MSSPSRLQAVLVSAAVVALAVAGCGKGSDDGGGGGIKGDKLDVGAALSLTGSIAKEGRLTKQGYDSCVDKVNAKGGVAVGDKKYKLAIAYKDDKSEPDTAAQLVDQFNDSGKKLILGPYGSPSTEAASAVIERNGQVMLDSSGADNAIFSKGYKNTFAVLSPATEYLATIVKAIATANPKPATVAIISADDGFSKTAAKGGAAEAKKQGMKVLTTQFVAEHTTNVSSALTKIKSQKPDLILVSGHVEEGIAAIKQSKELGVTPAGGFGETVAPPTPDFKKALGASAEGVVGSTQWTAQTKGSDEFFGTAKDYADGFKQKFGDDAEYHSAEAAAACLALVEGVQEADSAEPEKVRDAIAGLDIESFFGPIKFDPTGKNVSKPMSAIQIQGGKVVTVYPSDQANGKLKWPGTG